MSCNLLVYQHNIIMKIMSISIARVKFTHVSFRPLSKFVHLFLPQAANTVLLLPLEISIHLLEFSICGIIWYILNFVFCLVWLLFSMIFLILIFFISIPV